MAEPEPLSPGADALFDEIANAVAGPALRAAAAMRLEQVRLGHSRESDSDLPLHWLAKEAKDRLQIAVDRTTGAGVGRDLARARLAALRGIGMALAYVDRLDAVIAAQAAKRRNPDG